MVRRTPSPGEDSQFPPGVTDPISEKLQSDMASHIHKLGLMLDSENSYVQTVAAEALVKLADDGLCLVN
jgi:hypothetical protein